MAFKGHAKGQVQHSTNKVMARNWSRTRNINKMKPIYIDVGLISIFFLITVYLEHNGVPHEQPALLTDASLQKPTLPDIVPSRLLLILAFFVPPFVHILLNLPDLPNPGTLHFVAALFQSNIYTMFTTNVLKLFIGRPRPFFATACKSYDPPDSMSCTGDAHLVREARKSFPSGHSSLAFSAAVFLSLYIAMHIGLLGRRARPSSAFLGSKVASVLFVTIPIFVAALVAASRIVDFHHHYADIIAGSCIGSFHAFLVFTVYGDVLNSSLSSTIEEGSENVVFVSNGRDDPEEV